jgi:hypothetical protein
MSVCGSSPAACACKACTAYLAAIHRHRTVQRHVLRLHRHHTDTVALRKTAKRRNYRAFACI